MLGFLFFSFFFALEHINTLNINALGPVSHRFFHFYAGYQVEEWHVSRVCATSSVTEQRESGRLTSLSDPLPPPQLSLVTVETGRQDESQISDTCADNSVWVNSGK